MFKSILIANRGEIACRVIKTAKQMGIETHIVFHNKDYSTPHTKQADYAHEIIGPNPTSAYLDMDQIVTILKSNQIEVFTRKTLNRDFLSRKNKLSVC